MIWRSCRWKVSEIYFTVTDWISVFSRSTVDNDLGNAADPKVTKIHSCLHRLNLFFSRSIVDNDQENLVDRKWVKFTSPSHQMKMSFEDPSSSIISTIPAIKCGSSSLLSSGMNLYFLDQSSTMIKTNTSIKVTEIRVSLLDLICRFKINRRQCFDQSCQL